MIFYLLIKSFEKTNKITFCDWLRLGDTKKGVLSRFFFSQRGRLYEIYFFCVRLFIKI